MCFPCNLCCGLSLRTGTKAVAVFEIVASFFIAKFGATKIWTLHDDSNTDDPKYLLKLIIWSFLLGGSVFTLIMGFTLFRAAKMGNSLRVKVWLIIHGILFILEIAAVFFNNSWKRVSESPEMKAKSASGCIFSLYCLAVVYTFFKQQKAEQTQETYGLQVTTFTAV